MERKDTLNDSHGAEERQLPDIPGINVDKGIKRVAGNLSAEVLQDRATELDGALKQEIAGGYKIYPVLSGGTGSKKLKGFSTVSWIESWPNACQIDGVNLN